MANVGIALYIYKTTPRPPAPIDVEPQQAKPVSESIEIESDEEKESFVCSKSKFGGKTGGRFFFFSHDSMDFQGILSGSAVLMSRYE